MLCDGEDARVRTAIERLRSKQVVEPIVLGGDGLNPAKDPRLGRIARFLRERRPDRIRDGVHALDVAADPINFGAALVALGEADGCVAGAACPTGDVVRAALWAIGRRSPWLRRAIAHAWWEIRPGSPSSHIAARAARAVPMSPGSRKPRPTSGSSRQTSYLMGNCKPMRR